MLSLLRAPAAAVVLFAVLGMLVLGGKWDPADPGAPRLNFNSFGSSLVVVFDTMTGSLEDSVFYAMYKTQGWAVLYYMAVTVLGNFLVGSPLRRCRQPLLPAPVLWPSCPQRCRNDRTLQPGGGSPSSALPPTHTCHAHHPVLAPIPHHITQHPLPPPLPALQILNLLIAILYELFLEESEGTSIDRAGPKDWLLMRKVSRELAGQRVAREGAAYEFKLAHCRM